MIAIDRSFRLAPHLGTFAQSAPENVMLNSMKAILCLPILALASCTAAPIAELWPPKADESSIRVDVTQDDWHSFLNIVSTTKSGGTAYEQWEFAERGWYLENGRCFTGACRSLVFPSASSVGNRMRYQSYSERFPERSPKIWSFVVSSRGLERMRSFLENQIIREEIPSHPFWHSGVEPYCVTYNCHHFILEALREAGLPVRPWWGYTAWMTAIQLDRVQRFHEEAGFVSPLSSVTKESDG